MTKTTTITLDRLAGALAEHGVTLKRTHLLQVAAKAFGYANTHQFTAADKAGDLKFPAAGHVSAEETDSLTLMTLSDPAGGVFALPIENFLNEDGRGSSLLVSPYGGILDISGIRDEAKREAIKTNPEPIETDISWFTRDEVTSIDDVDPKTPLYLTNGCCEHAHGSAEIMEALGLHYGEFNGDFYPLTDKEASYIGEDVVTGDDGIMMAMTGYSALYDGKKYIMPSIELPFGDDQPPRDEVLKNATLYASRISSKVEAMNGKVFVNTGIDDQRIIIQILVPFTELHRFKTMEEWNKHLAWLIVDPALPGVKEFDPVRYEGEEFAVSLEWIGEGNDGEYDPTWEYDQPLLRYDAQRLVDGEWEDLEDGSYCTQLSAYAGKDIIEKFARYLTIRLDAEGGAYPKRLLESLSWINQDVVEEFFAAK